MVKNKLLRLNLQNFASSDNEDGVDINNTGSSPHENMIEDTVADISDGDETSTGLSQDGTAENESRDTPDVQTPQTPSINYDERFNTVDNSIAGIASALTDIKLILENIHYTPTANNPRELTARERFELGE